MKVKLVIAGGGTGGHLFPGIAVADELLSRYPGSEVLFISPGREIDRLALAEKPYRQAVLTGGGLKGVSWRRRLSALARIPLGFGQALSLLREFRPDLVLGVGGYVTGPVLIAARLLRITACIHEQNSVPGLANRLLGPLVDHIFLSLPISGNYFPAAKTSLVGNPLRRELLAAAALPARPEAGRKPPRLLVLGGSQGARRINLLMVEAARKLAADGVDFELSHQTGQQDRGSTEEGYRRAGVRARVEAFIPDMAAEYLAVDLVISRAGATTLAELALFGKAALLIPYPFATDDHQRLNAEIMVRRGAARLLTEDGLSADELAEQIKALLHNEADRQMMGIKARKLSRPDAAATIIDESLAAKRK
ncbi:MAG: undecaprenyldiphospho-muramoylpentapeptide beta-N-acetylglucosaminyltransferase [Desulfobulbaceae bacterium]|nr:MAG: undecaprenyldiphospho-muramoylpentapeptide beta-N-acetylglucosaminyltransferase [Desulfobulbaceae bacterium]